MYSCGTSKRESVVVLKTTAFKSFASNSKCRFDKRFDELHQANGCRACTRQWDVDYLKASGLIKV